MVVPSSPAPCPIMPKHVLEPVFKAGNFASAYNVSTPPDQIVTSGPWRLKQYVGGREDGARAESVLVRRGQQESPAALPRRTRVPRRARPGRRGPEVPVRPDRRPRQREARELSQWYADNQQQGNYTLYDLGPALEHQFLLVQPQHRADGRRTAARVGDPYVDPAKYRWFNNPVFRRAVSMAVDREAMIPSIFFGDAVKNWSTSTPGSKGLVHAGHRQVRLQPRGVEAAARKPRLEGREWRRRARGRPGADRSASR